MEGIKMQIITKQYKVYEFNELSKEAKQKVINDYYKHEQECGNIFLEDDILNEMGCIDEYNIFEGVKLCYSLSYCQGDGLSFESTINLKNFLRQYLFQKITSI